VKICSKCKDEKSLDEFHSDKTKSDGKYSSCKSCAQEMTWTKEYRDSRRHPRYGLIKRRHKAKKYGITIERRDEMFQQQNGRCAICDIHEKDLKIMLSIDHSHESGKVRGLLCGNCNRGLGYLKDSPIRLAKAIQYLEKSYA
jgi:hypothetical protein